MALATTLALVAACGDDSSASPAAAGTDASATSSANPAAKSPTPANEIVAALQKLDVPQALADGPVLAKPDTKVTLAVFEDFQCPHCLRYTALLEPVIVDEYVKTGKVRLEFHQLPILGQESVQAAVASWCAGEQNQFWAYHKKLFMVQAEAGQATAEKVDAGRFSTANLGDFATGLGLDRQKFDDCYASDTAAGQVRADYRMAQGLGLRGTPSFLINGQPLVAGSPADAVTWRKVLDNALAGK